MKTKWWLAVLWEDQRAVRGGFYPSPHYLCHAYSCNIYNKHLKWNHKAHTRHECSGLLSEKPSENYVFVFKVGPVTRLFRKWRSLKHRLCRETMRLPEHIPDDNNRPSKRWPLAQRLSWVLNTLHSSDLMTQNLSLADKRDLAIVSQNPRGSLEPPRESAKKLSVPACPDARQLWFHWSWEGPGYQRLFKHGPLPTRTHHQLIWMYSTVKNV